MDDNMDEDINDDVEDEEGISNGFKTLGLMGNVAYLGEESFKCPVCGIKLDSQHTFTLHIRSHNPNDHSNTCSLCGKTLSSASSLDRHMLIHSGERPFKCSLCGMAFTTNGNMHRHMRTHGHGSIGYTPRGQKRRAKLLSQALEKAMAAAAAGEQVDFDAINRLKKSILESKVITPIPTPASIDPKKNGTKQQTTTLAKNFPEQILSSLTSNVPIEVAAAAAVAAHNSGQSKLAIDLASHLMKSNPNPNPNTQPSGKKQKIKNKSMNKSVSNGSSSPSSSSCTSSLRSLSCLLTNSNASQTSSIKNEKNESIYNQLSDSFERGIPIQHSLSTSLTSEPNSGKNRPGRKRKRSSLNSCALAVSPSETTRHTNSGIGNIQSSPSTSFKQSKPPSKCPICAHSIHSTTELHVHMMTFHFQERLFCNDCGMILDNYDTYTQHHCTASAATVMNALAQNPNLRSDLLFCSSNTFRMNFSSAGSISNLELLKGLSSSSDLTTNLLKAAQLANFTQVNGKNGFNQSLIDLSQPFNKYRSNELRMKKNSIVDRSLSSDHRSIDIKRIKHHSNGNPLPTRLKSETSNNNVKDKTKLSETMTTHLDPNYCYECDWRFDSIAAYHLHQLTHSLKSIQDSSVSDANMLKYSTLSPILSSIASNSTVSNSSLDDSTLKKKKNLQDVCGQSPAPMSSSLINMKSDLADIESILSTVQMTANQNSRHSDGNHLRSPISPNRASDAGDCSRAHKTQSKGGDATNQPDSPASADSAAVALNSSSLEISSRTAENRVDEIDSIVRGHVQSNQGAHISHRNEDSVDLKIKKDSIQCSDSKASFSVDELNATMSQTESVVKSISNVPDQTDVDSKISNKSKIVSGSSSRFRCEPCRLSFKSMNALRRHNRGHTAEGGHSHACNLCPYKSLDKSTLIRHFRTHNGERPFQCAICKYAFTTKANCERHVRKRHRNLKSKPEIRNAMQYNRDMAATAAATRLVSEKIFIERDQLPTSQDTICKKCEIDFGSNRELRAHLRIPNNPCSQQLKPFVCMLCNIGFNTRNNCVRHIIKQHPSTIDSGDDDRNSSSIDIESLLIETGSSSCLSPKSNYSSTSESTSRNQISMPTPERSSSSETESIYDGFHHSATESINSSEVISFNQASESSFVALRKVAQQNEFKDNALNLSIKSSNRKESSTVTRLEKSQSMNESSALDLSLKIK
ncbi:Ras-responsive element-binding protein 1 [Sarcoptes scabiei]|uniref:Ras-responsive element-binding protein 1 n=1 Tax=Sarcoptes scabiei TaxID=52283 RepID=A0A834RL34_SARSC|nr:Ras-responsive element-binding protein 1 [Sarcoptes scabiei]